MTRPRLFPSRPATGASLALIAALAALGVLACSGGGDSPPAAAKRVLVVHSYDDAFRWTQQQGEGIVEGLRRGGFAGKDYDLRVFFMDGRLNQAPDQLQRKAAEALRLIDDFEPDVVFVTDDPALQLVAVPHAQGTHRPDLPFVFSGINVDPTVYPPIRSLDAPGGPLTGTLERIPFTEAFATARRVFPAVRRTVLFADDSTSSAAVVADFKLRFKPSPDTLEVVDFIQISTFDDWKQKVASYQDEVDAIGVLNYHRVKDAVGQTVAPKEVAEWTVANSKAPVYALVSDWASDGILIAVGNSGLKTGDYVGLIGAQVLGGAGPSSVAIVDPHLVEASYNLRTADRLGIKVPDRELMDAAQVFR